MNLPRRLLLVTALIAPPAFATSDPTASAQCGGFPALDVKTLPGFCAAIVSREFKFPRGVLPLATGDVIVVDMGGWTPKAGSVWMLRKTDKGFTRELMVGKLDRPHGIALGPDGRVYVGEVGRVFRFDVRDPAHTAKDVIGGTSGVAALPGTGRHAMTAMLFDHDGNLFVSVGSASDHCENADGKAPDPQIPCAEAEGPGALGAIRKYSMAWPEGSVKKWEVFARGLRNSMAVAYHPTTKALWQADNARDFINAAIPSMKHDQELPHDELNLIKPGGHYGWPYCYDANLASPEYAAANCAAYRAPVRLLPAHAAPLGMLFYTGKQFPPRFQNSLIMTFHGYRQHGHRLIALLPDKAGAPKGKMVDLISGWGDKKNQRMGAPVSVALASDGSLYIVEDRPGRVIRLQYQEPSGAQAPGR